MNREALALAVAEILVRRLPGGLPQDAVESVAADLVRLLESAAVGEAEAPGARHVVVTSVGRNRSGIIHAFSEVLAEQNVDIVDLNQTIVHGNYAMMMIVGDPVSSGTSFEDLKTALKGRAQQLGVNVYVQYEDMLRAINRL